MPSAHNLRIREDFACGQHLDLLLRLRGRSLRDRVCRPSLSAAPHGEGARGSNADEKGLLGVKRRSGVYQRFLNQLSGSEAVNCRGEARFVLFCTGEGALMGVG